MDRSFPIGCAALIAGAGLLATSCAPQNLPVASRPSNAQTADGSYIVWREHLVDTIETSGVDLSGSDGLTMGDLDLDGWPDFVSVHESDTEYGGEPAGFIRIAFGSADPDEWTLITLAEGPEAGAAEDVDIADVNGDGWPDIIAACELEHLIYFQNPGANIRTATWPRIIPEIAANRGSFIRAFFADFNGDGKPEVTAANKGKQLPGLHTDDLNPISWFEITGDPLKQESWVEHELTRVDIPENARPLDIDGDGDLDILGGSRGEERAMWFENLGTDPISFFEHPIRILEGNSPYPICAVNVGVHDFNGDQRLDVVVFQSNLRENMGWIEQPADPSDPWKFHHIGTSLRDSLIGVEVADINGDGHADVMTGSYSAGSRDGDDAKVSVENRMGRLAWFENPGDHRENWIRHDISRRVRGMFDKFETIDLDGDGDLDFVATRGNSYPYDGVFWLEQIRTEKPAPRFTPARPNESQEMGLPREP